MKAIFHEYRKDLINVENVLSYRWYQPRAGGSEMAENFDEVHDPFDRRIADEKGILRKLAAERHIGPKKLHQLTGLSFGTCESFFTENNIRHTKRTFDKIQDAVGARTAILDDRDAPRQPNEIPRLTAKQSRAVAAMLESIRAEEKGVGAKKKK
jgi:hypothetical protein